MRAVAVTSATCDVRCHTATYTRSLVVLGGFRPLSAHADCNCHTPRRRSRRGGTMERLDWENVWAPPAGKGGRYHLATPSLPTAPSDGVPRGAASIVAGRSGRHGTSTLRRSWIGGGRQLAYLRTFSDLGIVAAPSRRQPCRWRETRIFTPGGSLGLELVPVALWMCRTWFTCRLRL